MAFSDVASVEVEAVLTRGKPLEGVRRNAIKMSSQTAAELREARNLAKAKLDHLLSPGVSVQVFEYRYYLAQLRIIETAEEIQFRRRCKHEPEPWEIALRDEASE